MKVSPIPLIQVFFDYTAPQRVMIGEAGNIRIHLKEVCRGTFTVYVDGEDYDDGYVAFPEGYSGYYDFTLPSYGSLRKS